MDLINRYLCENLYSGSKNVFNFSTTSVRLRPCVRVLYKKSCCNDAQAKKKCLD